MGLLKSRRMSTTVGYRVQPMWKTAAVLHNHRIAANGPVERMLYDHPQSTGPTTATNFERSIK